MDSMQMTAVAARLDELPEELLLHIVHQLDREPPSAEKLRHEPSLLLTRRPCSPLKQLSSVSRRWRRLVLPVLFKHSRLQLDVPPRSEWNLCLTCNQSMLAERLCFPAIVPLDTRSQQYHVDLVKDATTKLNSCIRSGVVDAKFAPGEGSMAMSEAQRHKPLTALTWLPRFYHALDDYLSFIQRRDLAGCVDTFAVFTDKMLSERLDRFPHRAALRDWRYAASAAFWQHVFCVIDPAQITVVAPPTDMACLTNCAIDTFGDWAFSDMELHTLSLRQDRRWSIPKLAQVKYHSLRPNPPEFPGVGASSILHLRPWTHCSLNEGSFLKAYGTYEYFERGPPSLIYSIKDCLSARANYLHDKNPDPGLQTVRSFEYTGIFPFANHIDFNPMFGQLVTLDVQLAPDPQSGILDDKERTGKAELGDCWQELIGAYTGIARALSFPPERAKRLFPRLRTFVCRDYSIPALKDDLDQVFAIVGRNGLWARSNAGVFSRLDHVEFPLSST